MAATNTDQDLLTRVAIGLTEDGRRSSTSYVEPMKYCNKTRIQARASGRPIIITFPISCMPDSFHLPHHRDSCCQVRCFQVVILQPVGMVSGRPNTQFDLGCHLQIPPSGGEADSGAGNVVFISLAVAFISFAVVLISFAVAVVSLVVDVIPFLLRANRY